MEVHQVISTPNSPHLRAARQLQLELSRRCKAFECTCVEQQAARRSESTTSAPDDFPVYDTCTETQKRLTAPRRRITANMSRLARNGSFASTSSTSSVDSSSHDHILNNLAHLRPFHNLSSWFHGTAVSADNRYERIAVGTLSMGMAVMTREMMEMQVQQAPSVRGMMDCLPTRVPRKNGMEMGWRVKLGTWPLSKHEAMVAEQLGR